MAGVVLVLTEGFTIGMIVIVVAAARVSFWMPLPLPPSLVSWVGGTLTRPFLHTTTATSGLPAREAEPGRTGQGAEGGQPRGRRRPRAKGAGTGPMVMTLAAVPMAAVIPTLVMTVTADAMPMVLNAWMLTAAGMAVMMATVMAGCMIMPGVTKLGPMAV